MYLPTHKGTHILLCSIQRKKQRKQRQQHTLSKHLQFAVEHISPRELLFFYSFNIISLVLFTFSHQKEAKKNQNTFVYRILMGCSSPMCHRCFLSPCHVVCWVLTSPRVWYRLNVIWSVPSAFFPFDGQHQFEQGLGYWIRTRTTCQLCTVYPIVPLGFCNLYICCSPTDVRFLLQFNGPLCTISADLRL